MPTEHAGIEIMELASVPLVVRFSYRSCTGFARTPCKAIGFPVTHSAHGTLGTLGALGTLGTLGAAHSAYSAHSGTRVVLEERAETRSDPLRLGLRLQTVGARRDAVVVFSRSKKNISISGGGRCTRQANQPKSMEINDVDMPPIAGPDPMGKQVNH